MPFRAELDDGRDPHAALAGDDTGWVQDALHAFRQRVVHDVDPSVVGIAAAPALEVPAVPHDFAGDFRVQPELLQDVVQRVRALPQVLLPEPAEPDAAARLQEAPQVGHLVRDPLRDAPCRRVRLDQVVERIAEDDDVVVPRVPAHPVAVWVQEGRVGPHEHLHPRRLQVLLDHRIYTPEVARPAEDHAELAGKLGLQPGDTLLGGESAPPGFLGLRILVEGRHLDRVNPKVRGFIPHADRHGGGRHPCGKGNGELAVQVVGNPLPRPPLDAQINCVLTLGQIGQCREIDCVATARLPVVPTPSPAVRHEQLLASVASEAPRHHVRSVSPWRQAQMVVRARRHLREEHAAELDGDRFGECAFGAPHLVGDADGQALVRARRRRTTVGELPLGHVQRARFGEVVLKENCSRFGRPPGSRQEEQRNSDHPRESVPSRCGHFHAILSG